MKIVFFGTSHGVPEPHRRCSSIMIEVGGNHYFIDMGTQSIEQLIDRNIPIDSVKGIFITHMHGDHTNGLISFINLCSWYFKTAEPVVYLPGNVEQITGAMQAWISCNNSNIREFDFREVNEGTVYDDGALKITSFRTKHLDRSYAYLAEAEGKRVLFSGDLSLNGPSEDFPLSVLDMPLDLAVCEVAHFEATEYLPLLLENRNLKKLCFNHYVPRHIPSMEAVKGAFDGRIEVLTAFDGFEITV